MCCLYFVSFSYFNYIVVVLRQYIHGPPVYNYIGFGGRQTLRLRSYGTQWSRDGES